MSKAFDLLSESLNDAILDTQTKYLPRHKGKIDIKPSSFSQTTRLNCKQKSLDKNHLFQRVASNP